MVSIHYSYKLIVLIADWTNIEPACSSDGMQSPINLNDAEVIIPDEVPLFESNKYGCSSWHQGVDDAHMKVKLPDCRNITVTYQGTKYYLDSIHFHSPSEHVNGGSYYDAEAHMLHYSDSGEWLLVGVLLQASAANLRTTNNTMLNTLWRNGGSSVEEISVMKPVTDTVSPLQPYLTFFPSIHSFYSYSGSLTTPPCTSSLWFVFASPVFVSLDDLTLIRSTASSVKNSIVSEYGNTNRPIQPTHGRKILYVGAYPSTESGGGGGDTQLSDVDYSLLLYAVITSVFFWIAGIAFCVGKCKRGGESSPKSFAGNDLSISLVARTKRDSTRFF